MRIAWNKGVTKYKSKLCACGCGELVKLHKYPKMMGAVSHTQLTSSLKGTRERGLEVLIQRLILRDYVFAVAVNILINVVADIVVL